MAIWTPEYIDTALWLDAADSSTITESSGAVSAWADKSGNNRHATQATGSKQPTTAAMTIGGINVLSFNGSSNQLDISDQPIAGTTPRSIFTVMRTNTYGDGGGGFLALTKNKTVTGSTWDLCVESGGFYIRVVGNAYYTPAPSTNSAHLIANTWSSGNLHAGAEVYSNGSQLTLAGGSDCSISTSTSDAVIGATPAQPDVYFDGDIAEILIIAEAVGTADRQKIEGYLAHKWGIAGNLPSDHQYKSAAPTVLSVSGTITDRLGNPCQRKVYAVTRPTDTTAPQIIAHGLSDPATGAYDLIVPSDEEVTRVVVSEDDDDPLLNDIVDRVIPA